MCLCISVESSHGNELIVEISSLKRYIQCRMHAEQDYSSFGGTILLFILREEEYHK